MKRTIEEMSAEWWLNIKAQYPVYDYVTWQTATIIGMKECWEELKSQRTLKN